MEPSDIRDNYLKSWFAIDLVSCVPITYVTAATNPCVDGIAPADGGGGATKLFKILRLMRLAKLLRLARLKRILEKYEDAFDANQYLGLFFTLCIIIFMAHLLACTWYMVGLGEQPGPDGEVIYGWVRNGDEGKGWTDAQLDHGCVADPAVMSVR